MTMKECEVEEKAKTYILINASKSSYRKRVLKSEIGRAMLYEYRFTIILDQRNDEKAKALFREYFEGEIHDLENKLEIQKNKLKIVEEFESEE